jgi:hypothetical protein
MMLFDKAIGQRRLKKEKMKRTMIMKHLFFFTYGVLADHSLFEQME